MTQNTKPPSDRTRRPPAIMMPRMWLTAALTCRSSVCRRRAQRSAPTLPLRVPAASRSRSPSRSA
eukprot:2840250-Rhodomonas_salina.1